MKVLYVKNNNERAKEFQLQTIIYEKNDQKFVKKIALNKKAISFLKKMEENYQKLSENIINPNVKLAKILDKDENSLTFEFVEGISLEKKFFEARKQKKENIFLKEFEDFLKNSFKISKFNSSIMVNSKIKQIFGDINYSIFDGEICFDGASNVDLIFSNIIYKDEYIYIIDYEWVFDFNIPIKYILFRNPYIQINNETLQEMEKNFMHYVIKSGFHSFKHNYLKNRYIIEQQIRNLRIIIEQKENYIQEQRKELEKRRIIIEQKENYIQEQRKELEKYKSTIFYKIYKLIQGGRK